MSHRLMESVAPATRPRAWAARLALAVPLALYALGLLAFYPSTVTNDDEGCYLRQTQALLEGHVRDGRVDPVTGLVVEEPVASYPLGTAFLFAPFVWALGWRGAFLVPALALVAGVLLTARWLRDEGRSPIWALLVLGFPPALVLGRVAMGDVVSLAVVTLGLLCFWRGLDRGWPWWLASGFVAGVSLAIRNSNPLIFVPFFAGTVLRREPRALALVVGGICGLGARMLSGWLLFGAPLYERSPYPYSPGTLMERLPLYALGLLVFVPGGLVFGLAYRGRRWPELRACVVLFLAFYLLQSYSTVASGFPRRVVLALRYLIPLVPVLAFASAEAAPRLWRAVSARLGAASAQRLERTAPALLALFVGAIALAAFAVHPAFKAWSATQARIHHEISQRVGADSVVVTNGNATSKYTEWLARRYRPAQVVRTSADDVRGMIRRHGQVVVVLLDRSDTEHWRETLRRNEELLRELGSPPPELDVQVSAVERLRIWRLRAAAGS